MPRRKPAVAKKVNEHEFDLRDVVALYFGKYRHISQVSIMNKIGTLLTGKDDFSYQDPDHRNKANSILASQFNWLPSLEYNREGYDNWMKNLEKCHGEVLILKV